MAADAEPPFLIALNLTRRCNLGCEHCYLDARILKRGDVDELSTASVRKVLDDIAALSPGCMVVLTGGEPLLRPDLDDIARHAAGLGLMVVVGTNGILLDRARVRRLREAGVAGLGLSLDSLDPEVHDAFRGRRGAWQKTMAAIDACRAEKLTYQIHFTVTDDTAHELDAMIAFARASDAMVLNVFFLVCTGRGERVTNISRDTYERVLRQVAKAAHDEKRLMIRAKCAPHFKRMAFELDPDWPITTAHGYEAGGCLAGRRYARVTPEGDLTACPYIETPVGSVLDEGIAKLWHDAPMFKALRQPQLEGTCGACEYRRICGGCRARPLARDGNLMGEDFLCAYEPAGGATIEHITPGAGRITWTSEAETRLARVPTFVRQMVARRVEDHVRSGGRDVVEAGDITGLARARFAGGPPPGFQMFRTGRKRSGKSRRRR